MLVDAESVFVYQDPLKERLGMHDRDLEEGCQMLEPGPVDLERFPATHREPVVESSKGMKLRNDHRLGTRLEWSYAGAEQDIGSDEDVQLGCGKVLLRKGRTQLQAVQLPDEIPLGHDLARPSPMLMRAYHGCWVEQLVRVRTLCDAHDQTRHQIRKGSDALGLEE